MTDRAVLVLRALGVGDLLTGVPALRGLRRAYPSARIVLATPGPLEPLARCCGAVDEVTPTAGLGELHWSGPAPELAVNLHGSGPQSIADLMSAGAESLISHANPDYPAVQGPPWRDDVHDVDRWCMLLESAGISCRPEELGIGRPPGYPRRDGVVVIHPGAAAAARRWPADRFGAVAAALSRAGYRVVVTGSAAERSLAEIVAAYAGLRSTSVLAGELDLLGMVALISDARLLVCGDTGIGHIATATGTASVLLFGPTPPAHWGPRGPGPHIAIWTGDRGDPHGDRPDAGLLLITPARVIAAAREILAECA
ncbi:glycosyltransferase family 9 protein [Mycolicibacter senuensis]|uniref:glycosyltransferase family 9 protein n=1 Tax=Mycolicibacter senuensis TaxID=386913 RepID=UPI001F1D84E5|nr:glycosyltransferase family 9 protein [Mycolicibacter senuensis]